MAMDREKEYELLHELEIDTTKSRLRNFTAFLSISFILPGLATKVGTDTISLGGFTLSLSQAVFLLGFLFYCFASYYYWWHHRYSHLYRDRLKQLEDELEINIFKLRTRPTFPRRERPSKWRIKFHFHWALYIIGIFYFLIAAYYVGWILMAAGIALIAVVYVTLMVCSIFQKEQPNEPGCA